MKKSLNSDVLIDKNFHISTFSNKKDPELQRARDLFETIVGCTVFLMQYVKEADKVFVNCLEDKEGTRSNLKALFSNYINILNRIRVEKYDEAEPSYCAALEKSVLYFFYLEDYIIIDILKQMFSIFEDVQIISLSFYILPKKKKETFHINFRIYQSRRGPCLISEG